MKFWDTSALVPLVFAENTSRTVRPLLLADPRILVSFLTPVEWRVQSGDAPTVPGSPRATRRRSFYMPSNRHGPSWTITPQSSGTPAGSLESTGCVRAMPFSSRARLPLNASRPGWRSSVSMKNCEPLREPSGLS